MHTSHADLDVPLFDGTNAGLDAVVVHPHFDYKPTPALEGRLWPKMAKRNQVWPSKAIKST